MRAHILKEHVDSRSKEEKLLALYHHERTEPELKAAVLGKLLAMGVDPRDICIQPIIIQPVLPSIETNVDINDNFSPEYRFGEIIDRLGAISPRPSKIFFLRPPRIEIFVPPPYGNLTRNDYINTLGTTIPGVRNVRGFYHEGDRGYWFFVKL